MKISEKTLELNICAQLTAALDRKGYQPLWFGLTQKQEARAGFDACTRLKGRLMLLQFKASSRVLKSGERVFAAPHRQMRDLQVRVKAKRFVYYAFPDLGTTAELQKNRDLLSQTWLLDVAGIPSMSPPTTLKGRPRKSGCHSVYLSPPRAVIRSKPTEVSVLHFVSLLEDLGDAGIGAENLGGFEVFWQLAKRFSKGAAAVVLAGPRSDTAGRSPASRSGGAR